MARDCIGRLVDLAARFPYLVLAITLAAIASFTAIGSRLEVRADLLELLPRDSQGFRAFEHQLGRVGGGATLLVIVESPDRAKNEAFIDDLSRDLSDHPDARIRIVESGTKDVRAFYERNKWLYASLDDLRDADATLDHQIAIKSGLVADFDEDDDAPVPNEARAGLPTKAPTQDAQKKALGMGDFEKRWDDRANEKDKFPSGYFANDDGTLLGLRIVSSTSLGEASGDSLLAEVESRVARLSLSRDSKDMRVGFTGDVASAAGERKALLSDAMWATIFALVVILTALVLYYRSPWAPFVIALPVFLGISAAYAYAEIAFGYVNTSGAFLGAIILGNGINYPIVLFARYREFRARGMAPDVARREAVLNAFRAELVGACVASIAYGSLVFTRFRGFSQFGAIGFLGMLFVWAAIVPVVPALIVIAERWQARLPAWLQDRPTPLRRDGGGSVFTSSIANVTTKYPRVFLLLTIVLMALAITKIPTYLADPWEYDFGKLGSKSSDVSGAGEWSNKANVVFGGKANIAGALMLADSPDQVPALKEAILANDARDPQGRMIDEITTIDDYLPGTAPEQQEKLAVLDDIRARLTPRVLSESSVDDRATLERVRPPENLRQIARSDLPQLLARRFTENDGRVGTILYVKPKGDIVFADGHNHLRLARTTDNVRLPDGTTVMTASRSTIFAEMIESMRRDGPLAAGIAFVCVVLVVVLASRGMRQMLAVLGSLLVAVCWLCGFAAWMGVRINYVNFIALPITLGIGCEYPFNIADRARILEGDVAGAVRRSGGAVMLCSFTTIVGYGSLLLSDFQALTSFGTLAVAGEIACIVSAMFVVPSLLSIARRALFFSPKALV